MHASSYIRYLKMSKSCKIDTNSYSAEKFLYSSDRSRIYIISENTASNFSLRDCNYLCLHDTAVIHTHLLNIYLVYTYMRTHGYAHVKIHSKLLLGRNLT